MLLEHNVCESVQPPVPVHLFPLLQPVTPEDSNFRSDVLISGVGANDMGNRAPGQRLGRREGWPEAEERGLCELAPAETDRQSEVPSYPDNCCGGRGVRCIEEGGNGAVGRGLLFTQG